MDAKIRANFINSVASGQKVPCPSCNALNNAGSTYCMTCGSKLDPANRSDNLESTNNNSDAMKKDIVETASDVKKENVNEKKQAFKFVESKIEEVEEQASVFAQGLPLWDVVPPQIMVRRKVKRC